MLTPWQGVVIAKCPLVSFASVWVTDLYPTDIPVAYSGDSLLHGSSTPSGNQLANLPPPSDLLEATIRHFEEVGDQQPAVQQPADQQLTLDSYQREPQSVPQAPNILCPQGSFSIHTSTSVVLITRP